MTSSYLGAGCATDLQMPSDITAYSLSSLWSEHWEEPTSEMIIQAEFKWRVCGGKCAERSAPRAVFWLDPRGPDSSAPSSRFVRPRAEETPTRPVRPLFLQ